MKIDPTSAVQAEVQPVSPVLSGRNVSVTFRRAGLRDVPAVLDCSVDVKVGETVALVGETGSGKTTLAMALMGALTYTPGAHVSGTIRVMGEDILRINAKELSVLRAKSVGVVFQEPGGSLHPLRRIGAQLVEVLGVVRGMRKGDAGLKALSLISSAGLPDPSWQVAARVGQLSGGMQQRAAIALALACEPRVIVADEPTTALDVSIQAQILELLYDKVKSQSIGMLLVTHDLGVVAGLADHIYVMYSGRIVEQGSVSEVLGSPAHPYTRQLIACSQMSALSNRSVANLAARVVATPGELRGCCFAPRCAYATTECLSAEPKLLGSSTRQVACWHSSVVEGEPSDVMESDLAPPGSVPDKKVAAFEVAATPGGVKTSPAGASSPLLSAQNVVVEYRDSGFRHKVSASVVRGVSLELRAGEIIGIVGESGSGKSTFARALIGFAPLKSGDVLFHGASLLSMGESSRREMRAKVQLMVQNSTSAFDPRMSVAATLMETLRVHRGLRGKEARDVVRELLDKVGLSGGFASRFPRELSGGQRQRVGLARALATNPEVLMADEPTASLDLLSRLQVLQLLKSLQLENGLGALFISHDIGAVSLVCDQVAVMYLGRFVERGPVSSILVNPRHPYTAALLAAVPTVDGWQRQSRSFASIAGEVPSVRAIPPGCTFHSRCPYAVQRCKEEDPIELRVGQGQHFVACWRSEEIELSPKRVATGVSTSNSRGDTRGPSGGT